MKYQPGVNGSAVQRDKPARQASKRNQTRRSVSSIQTSIRLAVATSRCSSQTSCVSRSRRGYRQHVGRLVPGRLDCVEQIVVAQSKPHERPAVAADGPRFRRRGPRFAAAGKRKGHGRGSRGGRRDEVAARKRLKIHGDGFYARSEATGKAFNTELFSVHVPGLNPPPFRR